MRFRVQLAQVDALVEIEFSECDCGRCKDNGCISTAHYFVNGRRAFAGDAMNLIEMNKARKL